MWFTKRAVVLALAVSAVALPAPAPAGERTHSGVQSLQLEAGLTPDRAGGPRASLKVHVDYRSTIPNQHIPYNPKLVELIVPNGMRFLTANAPTCSEHAFGTATGDPEAACPPGSRVGGGTVTADARPAIATPVRGTISIYNSRYDCGCYPHPPGANRGSRDLLFWMKTTVGVNRLLVFNVRPDQSLAAYLPAPKNGGKPAYSFRTFDFTIGDSTAKPFVAPPRACASSWPFAVRISNWDGPSIAAQDAAPCTPAPTRWRNGQSQGE